MSSTPFPVEPPGLAQPSAGNPSDRTLLAAFGLAVAFYFVVRGWLGASLVLLGLLCTGFCVAHHREIRQAFRQHQVRWLALAFASPMVAAIVVNGGHHEAVSRSFDAALRFLLALAVFLELRRRSLDFAPLAAVAVPAALVLCAALVVGVPSSATFYWDGRFATYFIDPIVLCQHVMIAVFICLFLVDRQGRWTTFLLAAGIVLGLVVALGTQSRGGWLMAPILATLLLMRGRRITALQISACAGVVLLACALAYWGSGVIRLRVDQIGLDIREYVGGGNRDTSVGLRLSLFRTAGILFLERPWIGWGFTTLPALDTVQAIAPFYTPALQSYFTGAGVHNEFLQAMMRMGILGLGSRILMFAVPFWIFAGAARSDLPRQRLNGYLGLVVVIGYITTGLTSEVTNLIYAASFYALLVALFAAGALPSQPR
jgi:O-antigen ligase